VQHALEMRKACTKSLEYGMQVYKGHAHEEEVKRFSPLLAELIEYPDKKSLELVLEVCMYAYTYIHTCSNWLLS